ncbi:MAG: bifunctional aspartate kinase/diaminopimelate decarboxylase, partial [Pseudomonadota bacterium]
MSIAAESPWVVMKFGGTSVASASNWQHIAERIRERQQEGVRVLIVHSAVRGVSDALEQALDAAGKGLEPALEESIFARHRQLGQEMGVDADVQLAAH